MPKPDEPFAMFMHLVREKLGDKIAHYQIPPPVFQATRGEIVEVDVEGGRLVTRFPILPEYLNPYGSMQGGMLAVAVDNTLGPLSMLVAPPNVTRHLEVTYSRPVRLEMGYIQVIGRLLDRQGQQLHFKADVYEPRGTRVARARAVHWIVEDGG